MKKILYWLLAMASILCLFNSCESVSIRKENLDVKPSQTIICEETHTYEANQILEDSISETTTAPEVEIEEIATWLEDFLFESEETTCETETKVVETEAVTDNAEPVIEESTEVTTVSSSEIEQTQKRKMPDDVLYNLNQKIAQIKQDNPRMSIGVGVYNYPDFEALYETNIEEEISAGCTVKAAYALFVLKTCEEKNIDISNYYLTYDPSKHFESEWDSGDLKYNTSSTDYTIETLITKLLAISDNAAYNVLLESFPLSDFQKFLNKIGGQHLYGCRYGIASVHQRKNEWKSILEYDGNFLRNTLSNTSWCYIAQGMQGDYCYMHKSGWSDGYSYTCAADCAVINNTLIIIITADYSNPEGRVDVVRSISSVLEPIV